MNYFNIVAASLICFICPYQIWAQDGNGIRKDTQNASSFINASSDSKPREVSLGLPPATSGAVAIFEDGLPVSTNTCPNYPYKSWHGGVSAGSQSNIGPMETAMRYNDINYYIYSTSKTGIGEKFGGALSYTYGMYGQHKIDLNLHGPLSKNGWYYSISTYQNIDPGSNRLNCSKYKDRHQFYKGVISKVFNNDRGQMSLAVQYVNYFTVNEDNGPFIFVGDGSVRLMDGFNLGHDQYLPADTEATFMDIRTGKMVTRDINKSQHDNSITANFNLSYKFDGGYDFEFRSRFKSYDMENFSRNVAGITKVDASAGYTYADGRPYSGNIQNRNFFDLTGHEVMWLNNAELSKRYSPNFSMRYGVDVNVSNRGMANSSAGLAHEVCANPQMLYLNGAAYYNLNATAQYFEGLETKAIAYAHYDWRISDRWSSEGFVRAGFNRINGEAANNIGDDKSNTRRAGYSLASGTITEVKRFNPEWAAGFNVYYRLTSKLFLNIESVVTSSHATISDYLTASQPSQDPFHTVLLRGGVSYIGETFDINAQITYLAQDNKTDRASFSHVSTKDVGQTKKGSYETLMLLVKYGISSLGLVTDANWHPAGGFRLHAQMILRNPKYRNFFFDPTFSDGVTEHYDFSGKHITAIPQVEITLDPSYRIGKWNIWLTARYLSKEYINKTNSLFFSGRIETFGGVDFALNKYVKFKLNLVNILNQKGASGSISSADLVEDASGYTNYLMAGKFIRPFTVELGVNLSLAR